MTAESYPTPEAVGLVPDERRPRRPWMREWRTPAGVAVGMNDDGTVDEILGPFRLHIEQMDNSYYWFCFGDLHAHFSYRPRGRCVLTLGWLDDQSEYTKQLWDCQEFIDMDTFTINRLPNPNSQKETP